jgi:plasmid stabilization system protein ParE
MWTDPGSKQLEEISDYISQDSQDNADAVITEILNSVDRLEQFLRLGRRYTKWNIDEVREILGFKWRIVYRIVTDRIEVVVEIIHGSRRSQG